MTALLRRLRAWMDRPVQLADLSVPLPHEVVRPRESERPVQSQRQKP